MPSREVEVWLAGAGGDERVGTLWSHRRRNVESQTFSYAPEYLATPGAYGLEPSLPLVAGPQQTAVGREMFGAFSDSAPDRWGRRLIGRAERRRAQRDRDAERGFGEVDYLLGVRDDLRQGALRFRDPGGSAFLSSAEAGVPTLLQLGRLLGAAERLERASESDDDLRALLRGGSSLGGARPKAHVVDRHGRLAIAKFPSPAQDEWDVIRWEAVALTLARHARIDVAPLQLAVIDGKPVLIVERFDRQDDRRVGYISAMTMLGIDNGETGSYLEIAEAIIAESPATTEDLHELWRRISFTVLVSNLDDHLRNHGFLRAGAGGWRLAPAFDLNPEPRSGARLLSTMIDLDSADASVDLLLDVADGFRLSPADAHTILREVHHAVREWAGVARQIGVPEPEITRMRPAFEHDASSRVSNVLAA